MFKKEFYGNFYVNIVKCFLLLSFTIYFPASFLCALDPERSITQYIHKVWTTEDGLPQNTILSIIQTADGYIWFGTQEGLARFDGVTFTEFRKDTTPGINSEYINTLFEDHEKNLWIGTREGLTIYKNGKFKTFTKEDGLCDNIVLSVFKDTKGILWIGTLKGLNRRVGGKIESISRFSGMLVKAIYEDSATNIWFGTDKGLARLKHDEFKFFTSDEALSGNVVQSILEDHKGNMWVAIYGEGLFQFSEGKFTAITNEDGLSSGNLTTLHIDKDNNLWIGTEGSGVDRITEGNISSLNSKNGLSNDYVGPIYEDREGSIWIGTEKGVNQLRNGKLVVWTKTQGLSDDFISCVYEDSKKRLWIGTYTEGLNILENNHISIISKENGLASGKITSLWEDSSNNLWIGTRGDGFIRLKDSKFTTFNKKQGLSHNTVWAIYEDQNRVLWIGTKKGLNKFENGKFRIFGTQEGLTNENIYAIQSDRRKNLWIGTAGGGLNQFINGKFKAYTTRDGLSDNIILCLYEDPDGVLWIGTSYGLNRFENGKFTSYTTKNGLFNNVVYQILEGSDGFLWMSSNKGIYKVKKEELNRFAEGKIGAVHSISYGLEEGMKNVECNGGFQPAGWKRKDGLLFFPTTRGLVMIEPGKQEINNILPPVYVEKLVVNGEPMGLTGHMEIGPGVNKLEFHYTALSYVSPQKVKFKFKLDGYDKEWERVEKVRDRIAYYGNLSAGQYTFHVKACNNDGVWNNTGAAVTVKILPFFWETWWFRSFAIILFAVISYFIINLIKKYINIFNFWKQKTYIGNYKIINKIGSGGMGTIYLAAHTMDPSKKVALKVLREEYSADSVRIKRFKQEAIIIDQIEHPNIVKIVERGEHEQSIYFAMELLSGKTLAAKLEGEVRLSIPDSLHIMKQVTSALKLIHKRNIIHRDLKPENIMLIQKENDPIFVKLLDFGLARAQTFSRLTETGTVMGTVCYLSPEQIRESAYSSASDIYSLGVTFYEIITGIKPFFGDTTVEIMGQVLNKKPVEPIHLRKETPKKLNKLIMMMIKKEPKNRPDIGDVCKILEQIQL